jgi:hypothetical protein
MDMNDGRVVGKCGCGVIDFVSCICMIRAGGASDLLQRRTVKEKLLQSTSSLLYSSPIPSPNPRP